MDDKGQPVSGVDYPRTFQEFDAWFATEAYCRKYLIGLRWPSGFQCPRCGLREEPWVTARGYLHCKRCEDEISIIAGTLFERTRRPLRDRFFAIWFVTSQKQGASALGLQRVLGLGSLPDCVDMDAQATTCNGPARAESPHRSRGGR